MTFCDSAGIKLPCSVSEFITAHLLVVERERCCSLLELMHRLSSTNTEIPSCDPSHVRSSFQYVSNHEQRDESMQMRDKFEFFELLGHYKSNMKILETGVDNVGITNTILSHLQSYRERMYGWHTKTEISARYDAIPKEKFKAIQGLDYDTGSILARF